MTTVRRIVAALIIAGNALVWTAVAGELDLLATFGCVAHGHGTFNACAPLDTSHIVDLRDPRTV